MPLAVSQAATHRPLWQRQLAAAVRDPGELLQRLQLPTSLLGGARGGHRLFRVRVPEPFLVRIRPGDPHDPLLRQVLPLEAETREVAGYSADPLAEWDLSDTPGLLQKYQGRALAVATGACAINCRYCFRRHFPYGRENAARRDWAQTVDALATTPGVEELILSGGDPLVLDDNALASLARQAAGIDHLRRLRVHTRMPVVIPSRVTEALLDWLAGTRLQPVLVIHANHPAELDADVAAALGRLREAGVTLLNQAVLLRGVNDEVRTLTRLSEGLFDCGVMPYYLHLLDPVQGAAHFDVSEDEARALLGELAARLPGYLVPKLAREVPGDRGKRVVGPQ